MTQPCRLPRGGLIEREREVGFRFNGRAMTGHPGDTLASALLANGVHLVARSFKYHRPRGILAAGAEEPNALVQLGSGARTEPNPKATQVRLVDGLEAASVNVFPSVEFDLGAATGFGSHLMVAGFYYKTFKGSQRLWQRVYEPAIRRAAGWGKAPSEPDPDRYDHRHVHCDVLVVGAGPAGLAAARAAAASDARVILIDEQAVPGGSLLAGSSIVDGRGGPDWAAAALAEIAARPEAQVLLNTTAFGYYDRNYVAAVQQLHDGSDRSALPRQRIWHIRAGRVVLATGAHERPLVFADNDRPGTMLAGAVRAYLHRWAVVPGRRAVLFANNDGAYATAFDLLEAGCDIQAVVDSRRGAEGALVEEARRAGIRVLDGSVVTGTRGYKRIAAVEVRRRNGRDHAVESTCQWLDCDLLCVSGGWSPVVHLFSQSGGRLAYDEARACFRPDVGRQALRSVGGCNATFDLPGCLREGHEAGGDAAEQTGFRVPDLAAPVAGNTPDVGDPEALWLVPGATAPNRGKRKWFVDLQNDTTAADIHLAVREGFESVEHMKRYTLAGFGTDQGKTSNINALAILAERVGLRMGQVGTTTFRPPYTAVTFGALAGLDRGPLLEPVRVTSIQERHTAAGAVFEDVGQWKRPRYFPRAGEDMAAAVARECRAVREGVGMIDASTLGKIDIQGPDSAEFLNRVYTSAWSKLPVGKVRYGIMCREDGMVFDDGTTSRIGETRYLMTTTTGGAAAVLDHLEEYLQTEWPELRVRLTSVTEQWASVGIAGSRAFDVLAALAPDRDLSPAALPFLGWCDATLAGLKARVFRISFTGELQYEVNVVWPDGPALWDAVRDAGEQFGITPYGTETMHVLRAEKGFIIVGQETDGTQTPDDLGLNWLIAKSKPDFVGKRSMARTDMLRPDRKQLVGLVPVDPARALPEGAQLIETRDAGRAPPVPMLGFVTSSYFSPALDQGFALALVAGGRARHGDEILAALPEGDVRVKICDPVFYDREGKRRDGDG